MGRRNHRSAAIYFIAAALFAFGLYLFYIKCVPLVPSFQWLYFPACLVIGGLASWNFRFGTLAFLFALPLVNNWPYFFGIDEATPHSPAALGLFLFYALGWLVNRGLKRSPMPPGNPVFRPMALVAALVAVSALITAWRFMNFYPLAADGVYDLMTNVSGVSAGGALMSTLLHSLNYLSGMAFFVFLCGLLAEEVFRKRALTALWAGLLLSVLFGFGQRFLDPSFGNTAFWVRMGQINATFKDPNAFGAVLAILTPLAVGGLFHYQDRRRILAGILAVAAIFIFPFIGTRSALLGLGAGLLLLAAMAFAGRSRKAGAEPESPQNSRQKETPKKRRRLIATMAGLVIMAVLGLAVLGKTRLYERLSLSAKSVSSELGFVGLSPERYFLWKGAAEMTRDYPFTGVGVGAFIIELPNYYTKDKRVYPAGFEGFRRNDSAENFFLQVSSELGLIGLLAFLWLLGIVLGEVGRGFGDGTARGPDRFLFWGAAGGILAYVLNIFFHSYIGSFETIYSFWFLAALVAGLRSGAKKEGPQAAGVSGAAKKHRRLFVIAGIVLVFGAVHAWNSRHSLSLEARTREFSIKQNFGLYQAEKTADGRDFHWTRQYGGLALTIEGPVMQVPVLASHPDLLSRPIDIEFFWIKDFFKEKIRLSRTRLETERWETLNFPVAGLLGQDGILFVTVSRTWIPLKMNGVPDPRRLGVALGTVTFHQ